MNLLDPLGWAILLLVLGCGIVVLEVFLPSGGVLSFLAVLVLGASVYFAFRRDATTGFAFITLTLAFVPLTIGLAFKVLPMTPMGKAFLGELPTPAEVDPDDPRRSMVGRVGVASSMMLPSGSVLVDGKLLDAVSQGVPIDPGTPIVVVEVRANRVMVRPADPDEARRIAIDSGDVLAKPIEEFGIEEFDEPLS
ncbi:MAG: hypothetical protein KF847_15185 [Pirellulales bacterium]|nr:hypothetical protein [Pirellulales bacterium]